MSERTVSGGQADSGGLGDELGLAVGVLLWAGIWSMVTYTHVLTNSVWYNTAFVAVVFVAAPVAAWVWHVLGVVEYRPDVRPVESDGLGS